MSESEQWLSDHPSSPSSSSATIYYVQRNNTPQEEAVKSGMFRMPSVKPCVVPVNICKSENSTNSAVYHERNVSEVGSQIQGHVYTNNDVSGLIHKQNNLIKKDNVHSVSSYPSTSLGVKRKHTQVSQRNVYDISKTCHCSHEDSYTTGYTSDDSEEDSLHRKRYKSRPHQNVGVIKAYPHVFNKSEMVQFAGRPLLKDKSVQSAQMLTKQSPAYFKHLKREPDFSSAGKYELEPVWEEKKYQLALREQQIIEAEEALKEEEEKAQECLKLALQQQELALNEREEALRLREAAVQKKLEQATKLLEESRKVVDPNRFRLNNSTLGYIGVNPDQPSYAVQIGSREVLNRGKVSDLAGDSRGQINVENKGVAVDGCRSLSENISLIEKKSSVIADGIPSQKFKSDTYCVSSPNEEIFCSTSNNTRNAFLSDVQGLHHVSENCDNKPSLEPGKVVRTYTRASRIRTLSEISGPSVLCKTDRSLPPHARSVNPVAKTCLPNNSLCKGVAISNEETVVNGGASVTITPLTLGDRPPRSFSAIPKLEFSQENEESQETGQMFSPGGSITGYESGGASLCDDQINSSPASGQFKFLPPKFVNTKPVPPVDKYNLQRSLSSDIKSEVSINPPVLSSHSMSGKGGLYPGTGKLSVSCKRKANLSMKTLAVISIPGCDKEKAELQDQSRVKPRPEMLHALGCCKSADSSKTEGVSANVQTKNFVCDNKDNSETSEETVRFLQSSVSNTETIYNQEPAVSSVDKLRIKQDVPCHVQEEVSQSFGKAQNMQQWHGRPFLPGDILYTPGSKLNSQMAPRFQKNVPISKSYVEGSQGSNQVFTSQSEMPPFKHVSNLPSLMVQSPNESSSSSSKMDHSLNSEATLVTGNSSLTGKDTLPLTSTPKSLLLSSLQGATLTLVSTCYSSSPLRKNTVSPSISSVQSQVSTPVDSNPARNSLHDTHVSIQQNISLGPSSNAVSSVSSNSTSNQNICSSSSVLSSNIQTYSGIKELQQKSVLKNNEHLNLVDETLDSRNLPQVLLVPSAENPSALEQVGSQGIGQVNMQVENMSQARVPQSLDFEDRSPNNFSTAIPEVLTNLGDYDPVSQTLTTSNPIFLQSFLANNVSGELTSDSHMNPVNTLSSGVLEKVNETQNTVQLETEDGCRNDVEILPVYDNNFSHNIVNKEQVSGQASGDNCNHGRTKEKDPASTNISPLGIDKVQTSTCSVVKNTLTNCDVDCLPETLSDTEGGSVKYSPVKLNDVTSDASRNFSDSESEFSRTGDRFFISTGILGTQDLTKTTNSLHDEYLEADESTLQETCYSDSDEDCKVEETTVGLCSSNKCDESADSNDRFVEEMDVNTLSECKGTEVEASRILESDDNVIVGDSSVSDQGIVNSSGGVAVEECNQDRMMYDVESRGTETLLGNQMQNSSCLASDEVLVHETETEVRNQNLEIIENAQNTSGLMDFSCLKLNEGQETATVMGSPEVIREETTHRNSRGSKRGRGRKRRSLNIRKSRNRYKSGLVSEVPNEVPEVPIKDCVNDNNVDGPVLKSSFPENEATEIVSVVSELIKESEYISGKEDTDSDLKKMEEDTELESEKFEHVSQSGRKVKLRSYLMKAVSKGNSCRPSNTISHFNPSETLAPEPVVKKKRGRKPRRDNKPENIGNLNEIKDNSNSKDSDANINLRCGKCDYIGESKAKFKHHINLEHNGLARPRGESQEFTKTEWNMIINYAMKQVKKLKCEICAKVFKSLAGYKYHVKFCGHSVEEVKKTCSICSKSLRVHNFQAHMRNFHRQYKRGELSAPTLKVQEEPGDSRPRRRAATNCNAKLKVWRSNPAEVIASDISDGGGDSCDELDIGKYCEKEHIVVPEDIKRRWVEDIKLNGKAQCLNSNCSYKFKYVKNGHKHYANCRFSGIPRQYKCKPCGYTCGSETEFRVHISSEHKGLVQPDNESDYDLSDEEIHPVNSRSAVKHRSLFKQSGDKVRPFEPALNWTYEFLVENQSEELFENFTVSATEWVLLNGEELRKYVPPINSSPKFKISVVSKIESRNKSSEWQVLDRFSGTSVFDGFVLFSGGPTVAAAWCPLPLKDSIREKFQFLAVSASSFPDKKYSVIASHLHKGVIQIWNCPTNTENEGDVPQFRMGIAHNYGAVWSLAWCPSGIFDSQSSQCYAMNNLQRLGLLAAACSDGTVRIFVIPHPDQPGFEGTTQIFQVQPKLTLKASSLYDDNDCQCLKIDWFRGKGHRYIAGAYSTGYVCIWDIQTSSPLLRLADPTGDIMYPVNSFLAHNGVCSTVAFCPTTHGRNLLTGGNDRTYKFWDLENTNMPLSTVRKGLVLDSCWLSHWGGCFISFDDVYGLSNTNTCFKENGFYGIQSRNVLSSNSPVWTISGSEWLNTLIQGDSAGEVVMTLQLQLFKNYENEKVPSKRKVPLLAVKMEKIGAGASVAISEKNRVRFPKKRLEGSPSQGGVKCEEDGVCPEVYLDLPRTYSESCSGYGIVFAEQDYHDFTNIPEAQLNERKRSEKMESGPLGCYPLMSATSVSWNNNFMSHSWVFVGTQSGLCRLVNVKGMMDGSLLTIDSIKKAIENMELGQGVS